MSVFDLATNSRRNLDDEAARNILQPGEQGLSAFTGFLEAQKSWLGASARGGQFLGVISSPVAIAVDKAEAAGERLAWMTLSDEERAHREAIGLTPRKAGTDASDWWFENVVDDIGNNAVDYWKPNPDAMGAAAKTMSLVGEVGGSIPQMAGLLPVFLGQSGVSPATELVRQGVDVETAGAVGGLNLVATGVGMRLPAAWGNTLAQRLATGTGSNLAIGVAADAGSAEILDAGGYEQLAQGYDAADPYARGLDILMGAAFGAVAHVNAPRLTPSQRDAVLTARNNDHLHRQTMPGEPLTPEAARRHADAMPVAMEQALRGEPVDVSGRVDLGEFRLRPELQPAPVAEPDYATYRRTLESNHQPTARAGTSSAYGIDQFTAPTWRRIVAQQQPAWAAGLSDAELLAQRGNPERSGEMAAALDRANTAALEAAGQPASIHNLYAMHHFGEERGLAFARAEDGVRIERILTKQQVAANPYLRGKTKGEVIAGWDERARRAGVQVPTRGAAAGLAFDPIEVPPARVFDGPEAGRVIDDRLAALDDLATRNLLAVDDLAALRREDAELVELLRSSERLDREGILPADPRARLRQDEVEAASARRAEIHRALEQHRAAGNYASEAADLRRRLDRIDSDADLIGLAERLAGVEGRPARAPRLADEAQPLPEPMRAPEDPATAARAFLDDATARVEAGETVAADFGPVRVEAGPEGFRVTGLEQLDPSDVGAAAARLGELLDRDGVDGVLREVLGDTAAPRPAGEPAALPEAGPGGIEAHAAATTLQTARGIAQARPDLTVTLDDGQVVPIAQALADADAAVDQARSDSRAFAAAMACAMRFL